MKQEERPYVYIIKNIINGKKYIGLSINKKKWFKKNYYGSGKVIRLAIKKYGKNKFTKRIIKEFDNKKQARKYERYLISYHKADTSSKFYNLGPGGFGGAAKGHVVTKETRDKLSKIRTGVKRPKYVIEKMRKSLTGIKWSRLAIKHRSIAIKKMWNFRSERERRLIRDKISKSKLGKKISLETKNKLSKINARLTRSQVLRIYSLSKNGVGYTYLKNKYKIGFSSISEIINKKTYKWVWLKT